MKQSEKEAFFGYPFADQFILGNSHQSIRTTTTGVAVSRGGNRVTG